MFKRNRLYWEVKETGSSEYEDEEEEEKKKTYNRTKNANFKLDACKKCII
jgi:hypothetical protein